MDEDFNPSQRELSFLISHKNSFWVLIIFFKMSTPPSPKMAKTLQVQRGFQLMKNQLLKFFSTIFGHALSDETIANPLGSPNFV